MPSSISNPLNPLSRWLMIIHNLNTNHHLLRLETAATHSKQQLISASLTFPGKRCAATRASTPVLQVYLERD
ncbi:MAG: hypothetical protein ACK5RI_01820 [Bacteroidota bacterium]|nr:hypothetical protein [Chitinophagaceae bacterium]MCA6471499.1 hypothetical protein [Chitinophagaceae bacterium]MCA6479068.1 hypothetical protein [Chitinophagaceae bacterium]MCA6488442.1 hypothetical protein [Chitinophagaceae bacterium]MCA6497996.1 hypothetical protein [Chitinophagaceae bacterium]